MTMRMKDIAKELGVSVVTISKVLRDHPDISDETRERVLNYVKKVDYQPNILARGLVTGRSYLVGLIVPDLLHPFFAEIAKSLSRVIGAKGYSLIIASSEEDPELEAREIRQLQARHLDALVIASCALNNISIDKLALHNDPYVLIDRNFSKVKSNFVGTDDEAAGRIATEHLIQMGCRRIAHISGRSNSTGHGRLKGYKAALQSNGLRFLEEYVVSRPHVDADSIDQGRQAMEILLTRKIRPDGVFCYNDPLAIGAMEKIFEEGLSVPGDVAVIGCGNLHYDSSLRIPLSSVDQHSHVIGRRAGEVVLEIIESKTPVPTQKIVLEPALVARLSTARSSADHSDVPKQQQKSKISKKLL
jgi:LacI family transcriptional regulator